MCFFVTNNVKRGQKRVVLHFSKNAKMQQKTAKSDVKI